MILISHRGNLIGRMPDLENHPDYIESAINLGYEVEIDLWVSENYTLYLGHDTAQYKINKSFLESKPDKLWIHCKNIRALEYLYGPQFNYFWHHNDTCTITSFGYIWAYPGIQIRNSIAVLPEIHNTNITDAYGVCSDFIKNYESYRINGSL